MESISREINRITLTGNLGNDPTFGEDFRGVEVARFKLATNLKWRNLDDNVYYKTVWHEIVVRDVSLIDLIKNKISKGSKVMVEGVLVYRTDVIEGTPFPIAEILVTRGSGAIFHVDRHPTKESPFQPVDIDYDQNQLNMSA